MAAMCSFSSLFRHGQVHGQGEVPPRARRQAPRDERRDRCPTPGGDVSRRDIVVTGHIHNGWVNSASARACHPKLGVISSMPQIHISLPGYKDDWADGSAGWAVEKGFGRT